MSSSESSKELRVKGDAEEATSEERKEAVRKLAGAIAHSLRGHGEVKVRCFGSSCVSKAARAIAIAREYMEDHDLELYCVPAFIEADMDGKSKTGLSMHILAEKRGPPQPDSERVDLKVRSDPPNVTDEERRVAVRKLAGAVAHVIRSDKQLTVRCFGSASIGKAVKAIAIARGFVATGGHDLFCVPSFIEADMGGQTKTGISFKVVVGGQTSG